MKIPLSIVFLLAALLLGACTRPAQPAETAPVVTATQAPAPWVATGAPTITPRASPSGTPEPFQPGSETTQARQGSRIPTMAIPSVTTTETPAPLSCYQKLVPGNYLLTFTVSGNTANYFAVGEAGEQIDLGKCAAHVSPDGRFALVPHSFGTKEAEVERDKFFVVDLAKEETVGTVENNCSELSLSLNALWVACPWALEGRPTRFGIAAFPINDPLQPPYFLFSPPGEDTFFRDLTWSPDGQWLAYQSFPFTDDYSVYVVDVTCLSKPTTCASQQAKRISHQVTLLYGLEWSPSGRYLLEWDVNDELTVYDVRNGDHFRLDAEYLPAGITGISWMPNSDLIAVSVVTGFTNISTVSADIYLFDLEGNEPVLFKEHTGDLLRSLTILPPFAPGLELAVSLAGHDLNLRAEPSLGGAVLRKLAPGTRLTILAGPVEAEGYTWWKMRAEDGTEGWAVEVGVWYQVAGGE